MVDRPILFSAPMVKALLSGAKTQTRRVLKPQPEPRFVIGPGIGREGHPREWVAAARREPDEDGWRRWAAGCETRFAVGDRLWVRETWRTVSGFDRLKPTDIPHGSLVSYDAGYDQEPNDGCRGKTRVAIHMPRWASRLTLTVTDVRVQRLQEITHADAMAEGVHPPMPHRAPQGGDCNGDPSGIDDCYRCAFRLLWMQINGVRANWYANPWIVALTFTVNKRNIDAPALAGEMEG